MGIIPFYIELKTLKHSHLVQKCLFSNGYRWSFSGQNLEGYTHEMISIDKYGYMVRIGERVVRGRILSLRDIKEL